jgi:hypothetical protein
MLHRRRRAISPEGPLGRLVHKRRPQTVRKPYVANQTAGGDSTRGRSETSSSSRRRKPDASGAAEKAQRLFSIFFSTRAYLYTAPEIQWAGAWHLCRFSVPRAQRPLISFRRAPTPKPRLEVGVLRGQCTDAPKARPARILGWPSASQSGLVMPNTSRRRRDSNSLGAAQNAKRETNGRES